MMIWEVYLNGQQYVIQAFAPYTPDKEIDLVLHASGNFTYTFKSTEILISLQIRTCS